MLWHVILGLLRDGRLHHGYELMTAYRVRSGTPASPGNFYRELARLETHGYAETGVNPPDADARRIPYHVTERGRGAFDRWLQAPPLTEGELSRGILLGGRRGRGRARPCARELGGAALAAQPGAVTPAARGPRGVERRATGRRIPVVAGPALAAAEARGGRPGLPGRAAERHQDVGEPGQLAGRRDRGSTGRHPGRRPASGPQASALVAPPGSSRLTSSPRAE